jgi:hypothetical protein
VWRRQTLCLRLPFLKNNFFLDSYIYINQQEMASQKKRTVQSLKRESDIEGAYFVHEQLGSGTSGEVYRLVRKENSLIYAGKLLDISNEENLKDVNTEVQRLLDYSFASTIQIFETYYFEGRAWVRRVEYCLLLIAT